MMREKLIYRLAAANPRALLDSMSWRLVSVLCLIRRKALVLKSLLSDEAINDTDLWSLSKDY